MPVAVFILASLLAFQLIPLMYHLQFQPPPFPTGGIKVEVFQLLRTSC